MLSPFNNTSMYLWRMGLLHTSTVAWNNCSAVISETTEPSAGNFLQHGLLNPPIWNLATSDCGNTLRPWSTVIPSHPPLKKLWNIMCVAFPNPCSFQQCFQKTHEELWRVSRRPKREQQAWCGWMRNRENKSELMKTYWILKKQKRGKFSRKVVYHGSQQAQLERRRKKNKWFWTIYSFSNDSLPNLLPVFSCLCDIMYIKIM